MASRRQIVHLGIMIYIAMALSKALADLLIPRPFPSPLLQEDWIERNWKAWTWTWKATVKQ